MPQTKMCLPLPAGRSPTNSSGRIGQGYQTRVGHGGPPLFWWPAATNCPRRAILRDPEILILDEPTSQIDPVSERLIHQSLERFVRNRTAIIITHRLSLLALVSRTRHARRPNRGWNAHQLLATFLIFREISDLIQEGGMIRTAARMEEPMHFSCHSARVSPRTFRTLHRGLGRRPDLST
jgi:hypothetical protein